MQYNNLPGFDKPLQPLEAWYVGGYVQDQWHARSNLTLTAGIRVDAPIFKNTAYNNPNVNALTFRAADGSPVQYNSGQLPKATPLWSPRVGFNWDVASDQKTQIRGGTGVFTGKPAYVWISNQIGNTGLLTGQIQDDNITTRPFNPNPRAYWPATVTGAPASSLELERDRSRFQVSAGLEKQHRRGPPAALGAGGDRRIPLQPRCQRHLLHQRQPAGRRSRHSPASTIVRGGPASPARRRGRSGRA